MLEGGANEFTCMVQGRWRSKQTIADSYYAPATDMMGQMLKMKTSIREGDLLAASSAQRLNPGASDALVNRNANNDELLTVRLSLDGS